MTSFRSLKECRGGIDAKGRWMIIQDRLADSKRVLKRWKSNDEDARLLIEGVVRGERVEELQRAAAMEIPG
jgi:hypothetical protein